MIEIDNETYAAVQALGRDVVIELARGLVRARMLHPVFAVSAPVGASVVYAEACELVGSVYDGEPVARQRAEAVDTAVTAIRYMGKFGVERPAGATESLEVAYDSDDDFEGVSGAPTTLFEMMEQTAQEAQRKEYYNCPSCGYELDTGWECNRCGADWEKEATGTNGDGYDSLRKVFEMAVKQASEGKGAERHSDGQPFEDQTILQTTRAHGLGFATGQAEKKLRESHKLRPMEHGRQRAIAELLGAINYTAAAVIKLQED